MRSDLQFIGEKFQKTYDKFWSFSQTAIQGSEGKTERALHTEVLILLTLQNAFQKHYADANRTIQF